MIVGLAALLLGLLFGGVAWLYFLRVLVSGGPHPFVPTRLSQSGPTAVRWFALGALALPAFVIVGTLLVVLSAPGAGWIVVFFLASMLLQTSCWLVAEEIRRKVEATRMSQPNDVSVR